MKKLISTLLVAFGLMTVVPAKAGIFEFGVKGGLNLTEMSFSKDDLNSNNRSGFFIGPTVKMTVPILGFGLDAGLLYDQRDAEYTTSAGTKKTTSYSQKSINIPVNVRYTFGFSSLVSAHIKAGPQFGFNIGDGNFKFSDTDSYAIKKSNFSINLGAGVTVLKHVEVAFNYNIAMGKTGDMSYSKFITEAGGAVANEVITSKSRANAWQISAAYYF